MTFFFVSIITLFRVSGYFEHQRNSQRFEGMSDVVLLVLFPPHTKNIDIDRSSIANRPKSHINSI